MHINYLRLTIITIRYAKRGKWVGYHSNLRNKIRKIFVDSLYFFHFEGGILCYLPYQMSNH